MRGILFVLKTGMQWNMLPSDTFGGQRRHMLAQDARGRGALQTRKTKAQVRRAVCRQRLCRDALLQIGQREEHGSQVCHQEPRRGAPGEEALACRTHLCLV